MSDRVQPFSLTGPLPEGVTVLEASAGTGKTYTIAALAARFIAEGRYRLDQLLLVTFTRRATGERRERVRERLGSGEPALADRGAGAGAGADGDGDGDASDEVAELLSQGSVEEVSARRARLAHAIENFDAATIATTHGFCLEVLAELGTLGDLEPDVTFTEDIEDLIKDVVDDLYVRRFVRLGGAPFTRGQAGQIARTAIVNPGATIHPLDAPEESPRAMRRRLAIAARNELERRKRELALMTYDDLLTRLRNALTGPNGEAAVARLQARYRVVLIDEFQDTDPVQWQIVERAFGGGGVTLVLIADPKQAIYAFRGADVYAYLAAVRAATTQRTLAVNWRSDQALIDAHDALFGDTKLGHPEISYRMVSAAPANVVGRLLKAPVGHALRVRVVSREAEEIKLTSTGAAESTSAREYVAKDLASDVVGLLSSGASIETRGDDGRVLRCDPLVPGDIAVLVRSHWHADLIHAELTAADVRAVINGAGSVFGTSAAGVWLRLLQALEQPANSSRARSAALTPLLGWSAERVATAGEPELEELHQRLHAWARVLRLRGVAALAEAIFSGEHVPRRVLGVVAGERELTDLKHVAELLHSAAVSEQLGPAALGAWLRQRIAAVGSEAGRDEMTRRLESDADAVQVLTIHRSKGLEFPVVYCPFLWDAGSLRDRRGPVYFHDASRGDERAIDVGLEGVDYRHHHEQFVVEERGEDLRLLYVALTRAKHQAVIWWASSYFSSESALGRLLFSREADGNIRAAGVGRLSDEAVVSRFEEVAGDAGGAIAVERATLGRPLSWVGAPPAATGLIAAEFDRRLDLRWRRTSYSDITAGAHEFMVGSEPEIAVVSDEPSGAVAVPLGEMPSNARVGTFIHGVLAAADFTAADLHTELLSRIGEGLARSRVKIGDPVAVATGLVAALETPFGADGLRLRDVARSDRLDELGFELPLAGGDSPTGELTVAAIASALRAGLASDDPLVAYAERLADPALRRDVRGFLTGSIDLVIRLDGGRFAVVDYKTNWLGAADRPLTAWDYRPSALVAEMEGAHYGLQALLYTAALHRYLRWRLPDYSAGGCLAGVHYLFLRGMVGSDTPVVAGGRCGVFSWYPPGALVEALSDVLDGVAL